MVSAARYFDSSSVRKPTPLLKAYALGSASDLGIITASAE
jgi:hypothetical protein